MAAKNHKRLKSINCLHLLIHKRFCVFCDSLRGLLYAGLSRRFPDVPDLPLLTSTIIITNQDLGTFGRDLGTVVQNAHNY